MRIRVDDRDSRVVPEVWAAALDRAVAEPGFVRPFFQAIVDLRRGVVCGYELLARFVGPPDAAPDVWFARAAAYGIGVELEARMIRIGMESRAALPQNCFVTINVEPGALLQPEIQAAFAMHQRLQGVVIELTEHSRADDEAIAAVLPELRARGALIALDDVGSGYSGLRRIGTLRPEFVKIDSALVAGLDEDAARREMVESLGAVANRIDAWVVAEGVEKTAELETLGAMGVPLAQGFLLSRPQPAMIGPRVEMSDWITRRHGARGVGVLQDRWSERAPLNVDTWEVEVQRRLREEPGVGYLAVVDLRGRPVGVVSRSRYLAGDRALARPPLRAQRGEPGPDCPAGDVASGRHPPRRRPLLRRNRPLHRLDRDPAAGRGARRGLHRAGLTARSIPRGGATPDPTYASVMWARTCATTSGGTVSMS
jgi:EAL domain-containing protein (putative c-di-GMP-specific phosphodiesterase class I)